MPKPGGIGIAGKDETHPVLERVLTGQNSTLLTATPIFGERRFPSIVVGRDDLGPDGNLEMVREDRFAMLDKARTMI